MHLDAEDIQRVLHGELPSVAATPTHLAACEQCQAAVAVARAEEQEVFALLGTLDRSSQAPVADIRRVRRANPKWPGASPLRWAAGFVLAVGIAGVAYALPSSPLRRWIDEFRSQSVPAITPPATRQGVEATDVAGVSISPGSSSFVLFTANQSTGELRISLADVQDIEVRAPSGAASFAVGAGRITIENAKASSSYEIRIPRGAPRVEIQVAGVRVWLKEGDRIVSERSPGTDAVIRIPLAR